MLAGPVFLDACAPGPGRSLPEPGGIPDEPGSADDLGSGSGKPFPSYKGALSERDSWNAIEDEHEELPCESRTRLRQLDFTGGMHTGDGVHWPGSDVLNITSNFGPGPGEILSGFGRDHEVPRGVRYDGHWTRECITGGRGVRRHGSREYGRAVVTHINFGYFRIMTVLDLDSR